uniref:Sodium/calcium exchanger membrane region domain-containing protein n=1 Tax=Odontella aurita TaxID=265563 RepID=A0A6U6EG37_9STRA|mmetsp:Transcript_24799/g.72647  ORF Transcript_24799/g.72647 Transcript_24799/m.72647 type:complete len:564 (+) Transcript_24799:156-1847(+)
MAPMAPTPSEDPIPTSASGEGESSIPPPSAAAAAGDGGNGTSSPRSSNDVAPLDYSDSSCVAIFSATSPDNPRDRCSFAETCNEGGGIFLSFTFCNNETFGPRQWCAVLSPFLLLWLVLLFRMLGSTAEDFFSPSLEMFSVKMGLPCRFAAVSLLALGNGAPDLSASVNAIAGDPAEGYVLILGALSGAGMFVTTIVAGSVILVAEDVRCRASDVLVYVMAVSTVYLELNSGFVGWKSVGKFFGLYCAYVALVFVADMSHNRKAQKVSPAQEKATDEELRGLSEDEQDGTETLLADPTHVTATGVSKIVEQFSNYRPESLPPNGDDSLKLHGPGSILADHERGYHHHPHQRRRPEDHCCRRDSHPQSREEGARDERCTDEDGPSSKRLRGGRRMNWCITVREGIRELNQHWNEVLDDILKNDDVRSVDKFALTCELPFTILRKLTVTIPCEGYYCRPLVALSLALSPLWVAFYVSTQHDANVFRRDQGPAYLGAACVAGFGAGALVLRRAGDIDLPTVALVSDTFCRIWHARARFSLSLSLSRLCDIYLPGGAISAVSRDFAS